MELVGDGHGLLGEELGGLVVSGDGECLGRRRPGRQLRGAEQWLYARCVRNCVSVCCVCMCECARALMCVEGGQVGELGCVCMRLCECCVCLCACMYVCVCVCVCDCVCARCTRVSVCG